jgi:spermidine/putrescine transport system ATP-binding protein
MNQKFCLNNQTHFKGNPFMSQEEYDVVLDQVCKNFGNVVAVDNISLKVRKGTFLTILGPSGCGKTTTLRLIGGFESPARGRIFIKGQDVTGIPPYKRETNLVFQDLALFPHMNVLNNIGFGLKMKGVSKRQVKEKVQAMLEMVELPNVTYRKTNQLSGGQRQRVALCRALIMEPAVLLLDEPLGALDAKIRKQMQTELKNLQIRLGRTFISVTHDQEEAMTMSDEIAIMNNGRIEQVGAPDSVYERPISRFVANFLGDCNLINVEIVESKPERVVVREPRLGTFFFHPDSHWQNKAGQKHMSMMIRPENITIVQNHRNFENIITGMIETLAFKGSTTEYVVKADSTEIKLQIQGRSQFRQGDNVSIAWRPEDCYLIP